MTTPDKPIYPTNDDTRYVGLSIREYFAAKCLAGLLANQHMVLVSANTLAKQAIICADALIEALNKGE